MIHTEISWLPPYVSLCVTLVGIGKSPALRQGVRICQSEPGNFMMPALPCCSRGIAKSPACEQFEKLFYTARGGLANPPPIQGGSGLPTRTEQQGPKRAVLYESPGGLANPLP